MQSLIVLAPRILEIKKSCFRERMTRFFEKTGTITFVELQILLNDEFINEMTLFICSECKDIVKITLEAYDKQIK